MKRRAFVAGLVSGLALAGPVLAGDVVESIVRQLKKQGFRSVVQERTLLGRVRIVAQRKDGMREIIVNPRTGEILRDLWTPLSGASVATPIIKEPGTSGGNHGGGKNDDDDDDDEHEVEDDDEDEDGSDSGGNSGSGNSGSGSSGSGSGGSGGGDDKGKD